jgi:hypothetical protein
MNGEWVLLPLSFVKGPPPGAWTEEPSRIFGLPLRSANDDPLLRGVQIPAATIAHELVRVRSPKYHEKPL